MLVCGGGKRSRMGREGVKRANESGWRRTVGLKVGYKNAFDGQ